MNLIFITPAALLLPCGKPVKSWINSIHLFKSVYYLMSDTSVQLCGQTQIKLLLISTLVKIEPYLHQAYSEEVTQGWCNNLWQFK